MKSNNLITKGIIVFLFVFFSSVQAQVTFRPGLRAGANFSHFSKGNDFSYNNVDNDNDKQNNHFSTKTDFYIGFFGAIKLSKYYTLQPEIVYSSQGAKSKINGNYDIDYLSAEIINKFTFNDKFNIHFGPTLDFEVSKNFNTRSDVDMGFVLGTGFQFTRNFGLDARMKKGIITVFKDNTRRTNVVFSVGGTYTFDVN